MQQHNDLALKIAFGSLRGASSRDGESKCRTLIENHFGSPANCYFFFKKVKDVTYYEIQEGGNGKAFLPSVIKLLKLESKKIIEDDEDEEEDGENNEFEAVQDGKLASPESEYIYIPSSDRMSYVERKGDYITFGIANKEKSESLTATEGVKRSTKMKPYQSESKGLLFAGVASFVMGFSMLMGSYIMKIGSEVIVLSDSDNQLQDFYKEVNNIENLKKNVPNVYVRKFYFEDGEWAKRTGNILIDNNLRSEEKLVEEASNTEGTVDTVEEDEAEVAEEERVIPEGIEPPQAETDDVVDNMAPAPLPNDIEETDSRERFFEAEDELPKENESLDEEPIEEGIVENEDEVLIPDEDNENTLDGDVDNG